MVSDTQLRLRYETGTTANADSMSDDAQLEVTFSQEPQCKVVFLIDGVKQKGSKKYVCRNVSCHPMVDAQANVRIRQGSSDGWGIEKLEIQKYPGFSDYKTYSMDEKRPQFWIDGNTDNCYDCYESLPSCTGGKWCTLEINHVQGNTFT